MIFSLLWGLAFVLRLIKLLKAIQVQVRVQVQVQVQVQVRVQVRVQVQVQVLPVLYYHTMGSINARLISYCRWLMLTCRGPRDKYYELCLLHFCPSSDVPYSNSSMLMVLFLFPLLLLVLLFLLRFPMFTLRNCLKFDFNLSPCLLPVQWKSRLHLRERS